MTEHKEKLFNACIEFVNKRAQTVTTIISSNQKALSSETKSSAGDKHETGRAMLQLEMEKASLQLEGVYTMERILKRINIIECNTVIKLGSLIITNKMNYFIAISAGKITIDNQNFYAISISSPIGQLLLGKTTSETFIFNNKTVLIKAVY